MKYLVCNSNSYKNTDYGLPITIHKSTDYRTSTGTHHRFIPPFPQDFDARVKVPTKRLTNFTFNSDFYDTQNVRTFVKHKSVKDVVSASRAPLCSDLKYVKPFEDKLFKDPSPPIKPQVSEFKAEYTKKFEPPERRSVFPPNPYSICDRSALGRDEQPPLRPDEPGFYKLLDIYLTTNRADYIPYSQEKQYGIARKDIVTFYDAQGYPRAKGYGPRDSGKVEPLVVPHAKPVYMQPGTRQDQGNKMQFVPNLAFKSEYMDCYENQTRWFMEPYKFGPVERLGDPLPKATPWQAVVAPGMYCSEYTQIGSGVPTNAVIEPKEQRPLFKHNIGCNKAYS